MVTTPKTDQTVLHKMTRLRSENLFPLTVLTLDLSLGYAITFVTNHFFIYFYLFVFFFLVFSLLNIL